MKPARSTQSSRPVEAIKVSQRKGKRKGKKEEKGRVGQAVQGKGGADKMKIYTAIGDRGGR